MLRMRGGAWQRGARCLVLSVAWSWGASAGAQTPAPADAVVRPVYQVAVVPQVSAVDLFRTWAPILERVGQEAGVVLELKVARDIPAFEAEVLAGHPDFAYLNPYHQVRARRAHQYIPLVRDAQPLTGLLVVRQDDPIRSVRDLDGKAVAFPAPNAFGASLLIRAHLVEREGIRIQPIYAKTHTNAFRQTLAGKAAATGSVRAMLEREPPEARTGLRVLLETPGAAPHPFSAHPRVPAAVRQAVQAAFIRLAREPAMQSHFQDIPMPRPVAADHQRDYLPLERLKLDRYAE